MKRCSETRELLTERGPQALPPEARSHLQDCADCARLLASAKLLERGLRERRREEPDLWSDLRGELERSPRTAPVPRPHRGPAALTAAAGLVLAVLAVAALLRFPDPGPAFTKAASSPAEPAPEPELVVEEALLGGKPALATVLTLSSGEKLIFLQPSDVLKARQP